MLKAWCFFEPLGHFKNYGYFIKFVLLLLMRELKNGETQEILCNELQS